MKTIIATLALLIALAIPATSHADYWMVYVKYTCPPLKANGPVRYLTATYKRRSLKAARQVQDAFRKIPKYRNCWIRLVRE